MNPADDRGPDRFVGVVAPFSTEEAVVAGPLLAAVREVVAAAGNDVAVVARDDRRDPERARRAVAALLAEPGCIGIVGPKNSGSALAAAPLAAAGGRALVLPCATADGLTAAGGPVFRLCAPDRATAEAAAALARELGLRRLAVVADDTAYGRGLAGAVTRAAAVAGLDPAVGFEASDGAFLAMGEVEQAALMIDLRDRGYAGPFLSAEGGPDAPVVGLAGPAAEGAWLFYPGVPVTGRGVYAAEAADAARVLLAAGEAGPAAIRAGVFEGETGVISFLPSGERVGATVARYRVVDGVALRQA